jgi:hypothetical protein
MLAEDHPATGQLMLAEDHPATSQLVLAEEHPDTGQLVPVLAEDHPATGQLVLGGDHPANIASSSDVVNAADFVNPAQLVNQPAVVVSRSQPMMDLTIGQPQLMGMSSGRLLAGGNHQPPPRPASPLGSPTAGLMCATLGDFTAQEDAALFSLPLPLSSDINS